MEHSQSNDYRNINETMTYFKKEETEQRRKPEASRIKEILKMRTVIHEVENRKTIEKINKTKT